MPTKAYDMRPGEPPMIPDLFQLQLKPWFYMQERPCTRCVKRNIGHLCHDEPREPMKRAKLEHGHMHGEDESLLKPEEPLYNKIESRFDQQQPEQLLLRGTELPVNSQGTSVLRQTSSHIPQSTTASVPTTRSRDQQCELRSPMKELTMLTVMSFGL